MDFPDCSKPSAYFNITENNVYKDDSWLGILNAAVFAIHSTTNRLTFYSLGQLVFGRNMILLIKHKVTW